jgi:uncharacterized protein HemX
MTTPAATSAKLRLAGIIILVAGMVGAGLVYWIGQRAENFADDPAMAGYNKQQNEQMERLYGKSGELMDDLSNSLKQPATQAGLILGTSIVVSLICFRLAQPVTNKEGQT